MITSYKPTPDVEVIHEKVQEYVVANTPCVSVTYDFTTSYKLELNHDHLNIHVNASVDTPNVDKFPIVLVKPKTFDAEFIRKVRKIILGDEPLYEVDVDNIQYTKSQIETTILYVKKNLHDPEFLKDLKETDIDAYNKRIEEEKAYLVF